MCESDIPNIIEWFGWTTTWDALRANGWEITRKTPHWQNQSKSYPKIYIRHAKTRYIGRLTVNPQETLGAARASLDFLTHERNARRKPVRVITSELTPEDISALYETILALQSDYKKPAKGNNVIGIELRKERAAA